MRISLLRWGAAAPAGAALCAAMLAQHAHAQSQGARGAVIEEVMVTAQKKAAGESAQRVPLSLTAVGSEQLDQAFVVNLTDVSKLAPNVQLEGVNTYPGFANFTIRGIGVNNSIRTVDPAVNIVVDGMVLGYQVGTLLDTFDVESVEILRGPQGTLFGKNSTGGVVSLRSRRPTEDFELRAKLTTGTANRRDASLSIGGGLGETLQGKIAVLTRNNDGYFPDRNGGTFVPAPLNPSGLQPANPTEAQSDLDVWVVKPMLVWAPAENLQVTLIGEYLKESGGGSTTRDVQPGGLVGAASTLFGYTPPANQAEINHDLAGEGHRIEAAHGIAEINWTLGSGVVTSVSAYREVEFWSSLDLDGTPFVIAHFPNSPESGHQFSEELRYASTFSDRFDFTLGGYYFEQGIRVEEKRNFATTPWVRGWFDQDSTTYAAFAQGTWHVTDPLSLVFGGRYTHEKKSLDIVPLGNCAPGFVNCPTAITGASKDWSDFSPKVGAQYAFNDDTMVYANWVKGFRSGNFNGRTASIDAIGPTAPEEVRSAELGLKSTFAQGRARLNLAAFLTKYDDIQKTVLVSVPSTGALVQTLNNAAQATIQGVELEVTARPVDALLLEANVGWTDAEYDRFGGLDVAAPIGTLTPADAVAAQQLEFDRVPKLTYYVAASYSFPIGDQGELRAKTGYRWKDDFFVDVINTAALAQEAYGVLDASLDYSRDAWTVSLFGNNLNDAEYHDMGSAAGGFQFHGGLARRLWGLEISYSHGR